MDIIIRIVIMILCELAIIEVSKIIANSYTKFGEMTQKNKILLFIAHFFLTSWFIATPGYVFINCFIYIIKTFV